MRKLKWFVLLFWVSVSQAWQVNGVPVVVKPASQYPYGNYAVSDGASGFIAVWQDSINGNWDYYGQRVDSLGHQRWGSGGLAICDTAGRQEDAWTAPDGHGGIIVAWEDDRDPTRASIYAQRVDSAGVPRWRRQGIPIDTTPYNNLSDPRIVSDGQCGAIIAWNRGNTIMPIYAQRVDSLGQIQWAPNGVPVCTTNTADTSMHLLNEMLSDGAGGAFLTIENWPFYSGKVRLNAQRLAADGHVFWPDTGILFCTGMNRRNVTRMISDGAGGAIIGWEDYRSNTYGDLYAQRLSPSGQVRWQTNGIPIAVASWSEDLGDIVPVGQGDFLFIWNDAGGSGTPSAVYAQKIDTAGAVKWVQNGKPIFNPSWDVAAIALSDGKGGAFLGIWDYRTSYYPHVYAQRVDSGGANLWQPDGVPICTVPANQYITWPLIPDGSGGFILGWEDYRNGNCDIYAQRVDSTGRVGVEEGGNNKLDVLSPTLLDIRPNPVRGLARIQFFMSQAEDGGELEIYDILGREIRHWTLDKASSGLRELSWDVRNSTGEPVPTGVYFCHLEIAGRTVVRKFMVVR